MKQTWKLIEKERKKWVSFPTANARKLNKIAQNWKLVGSLILRGYVAYCCGLLLANIGIFRPSEKKPHPFILLVLAPASTNTATISTSVGIALMSYAVNSLVTEPRFRHSWWSIIVEVEILLKHNQPVLIVSSTRMITTFS